MHLVGHKHFVSFYMHQTKETVPKRHIASASRSLVCCGCLFCAFCELTTRHLLDFHHLASFLPPPPSLPPTHPVHNPVLIPSHADIEIFLPHFLPPLFHLPFRFHGIKPEGGRLVYRLARPKQKMELQADVEEGRFHAGRVAFCKERHCSWRHRRGEDHAVRIVQAEHAR